MKKIILIACAILAMCGSACAFSGSGLGTAGDPYIITNVNQLQEMANELDAYYVLGNDIDASDTVNWNDGEGFEPVGVYGGSDSFTGTFDGQGHTITGLFINRPLGTCIGLFGGIGSASCEIKNVVLSDVDITGYYGAGSVVASHWDATVSNCHSSGQVTCINWYGGGFVGAMGTTATVTNCSTSCSVSGYRYTGGFCGSMQGTVTNCDASGEVEATYGYVGGFAGTSSYGSMSQCYATGNVTSTISNAGGFMGGAIGADYVIDQCYAIGNVVSNSGQTGGFIGDNTTGVITNCFATGSASGPGSYIGGFVGINHGPLLNCYSTGEVISSSSYIGGFCGTNDSTITYCYYDTETSGRSDTGKGTPKTTDQMMQEATFVAWDFADVWDIYEGQIYPVLDTLPPLLIWPLDIMPDSYPNPLDIKSKGVLPVAILGTDYFDVFEIDVASIRLRGVAPFRSNYEDVSTALVEAEECECISEGPDAFTDLTLKFDKKEVIKALRGLKGVPNGTNVPLTVTFKLFGDETEFQGTDCVRILKPQKPPKPNGPHGPRGPKNPKGPSKK